MPTDTPPYPQFTNLALGEGLFDQLMATVEHHLNKQFKEQRITAGDFAKVYVSSMEAVLGNSTQYLLGSFLLKEQEIKIQKEIEILDYQIDTLLPQELAKITAETANITQDTANKVIEGTVLLAQELKIDQEVVHLIAQGVLLVKQGLKVDKEVLFLTAKIASETANVDATAVIDNSVIGRQMNLLQAQTLGFAADIDNKAAKMHADYDVVYQSVHEATAAGSEILNTVTTQVAIDKAQAVATTIKAL